MWTPGKKRKTMVSIFDAVLFSSEIFELQEKGREPKIHHVFQLNKPLFFPMIRVIEGSYFYECTLNCAVEDGVARATESTPPPPHPHTTHTLTHPTVHSPIPIPRTRTLGYKQAKLKIWVISRFGCFFYSYLTLFTTYYITIHLTLSARVFNSQQRTNTGIMHYASSTKP